MPNPATAPRLALLDGGGEHVSSKNAPEYALAGTRGGPGPGDIAIVGAACRYPGGADDPESFWSVLSGGRSVLGPVPADRWDVRFSDGSRRPGTIASPNGGFLADIGRFDADFFGISPREAREMDPQQRILLEVAWEAMEDAGVPRADWAGSRTGVFTGVLANDYTVLHAKTRTPEAIDPYYATGKEFSFGAGRIAYTFDLHGPALSINTACSSSLVAVHLAAQSLRTGECDRALAGGVNLLVTPELSIFMSTVEAFSPSGQCRPFDAEASGVVRGEGCGIVVLERYADAVAAGDRVLAVICGSAVNQDGHSAGLTVPSGPAQEALLRSALAAAGIGPGEVDYVEAHATGTPLGDPVEVAALAAVFGPHRPADRPLLVGSHKANFGHTDSAAGIAGLLKVVEVVRRRTAPPQIRLDRPTPRIEWDTTGLAVPTSPVPLPDTAAPAVAGVSAFGLSGTNAHVIVAAAPDTPVDATVDTPADAAPVRARPLVLSAPTGEGLRRRALAVADQLAAADAGGDAGGDEVRDLTFTAAVRRTHHAHRLSVAAAGLEEFAAGLRAYVDGAADPAVATGEWDSDRARPVVFAFSGQGSQWPRMGLDLYDAQPVVRSALEECDELLAGELGWSLLDRLRAHEASALRETEAAQPAVFAIQVALARLWRSWGVAPTALVGHSMGEVAAAHVAGVLTLPDAARLIAARGRLMQAATGSGRMLAAELAAEEVRPLLDRHGGRVVVATVNGPRSVVLAGPADALAEVGRQLAAQGASCVPLPVDYAFHSPAVRRHGDELERSLTGLRPASPALPLLSSVRPGATVAWDAAYWGSNVREPVLFWPAVDELLLTGDPAFVEIGPHPVLARPLRAAVAHRERSGPVVDSLRRDVPGPVTLARSLGALHTAGVSVDWRAQGRGRCVSLPRHPWRDDRYWLSGVTRGQQAPAAAPPADPLVGLRAEVRLVDGGGRV